MLMLSHSNHTSAIWPSSMRKIARNGLSNAFPVAGNSPMGPVCVPEYVANAATRSPSNELLDGDVLVWEAGQERLL